MILLLYTLIHVIALWLKTDNVYPNHYDGMKHEFSLSTI